MKNRNLFLVIAWTVGCGSTAVHADECAFVAQAALPGSIAVIDSATRNQVAEIQTGGTVSAVAVSPNGMALAALVTDVAGNAFLHVIDTSTYLVEQRIPLPGVPETVELSPDGGLALLNDSASGGIDVVDLSTQQFVGVLRTGQYDLYDPPSRFAVSSDGSTVISAVPGRIATLQVTDVKTGTALRRISFLPEVEDPAPVSVTLSPDQETAYVGMVWAPTVEVDLSSGIVKDTFAVSTTSLALSGDGNRLYLAHQGGLCDRSLCDQLTIIDLTTGASNTIGLPAAGGPPRIAAGRESGAVYVAGSGTPVLYAVEPGAQPRLTALPLIANPTDIAVGEIVGSCRPASYTPRPTHSPVATATASPTQTPNFTCRDGQACLEIGTVYGSPGSEAVLPVRFTGPNSVIRGMQNDIHFGSEIAVHDCAAAADSSAIASFRSEAGVVRAIFFEPDGELIATPATLYTCRVTISPDARPGTYPVVTRNVIASNSTGYRVAVSAADGQVVIEAPRTASEFATNIENADHSSGSGCQMEPRPGHASSGSALIPVMFLLLFRRRQRS